MRSKTEWSVESDGKGKQRPVRIGLAPEQGKGIEYEFDLLLELSPDHIGQVIKDRTGRFQDRLIDKPDETFGKELGAWLSGEPAGPDHAEPSVDAAVRDLVARIIERAASARAWGQADEYVRKHFAGENLRFALAELEKAAEAAMETTQAA